MSIKKTIYEHLVTKKKYNTLKLKYEVVRDDLEKKQVELNTELDTLYLTFQLSP